MNRIELLSDALGQAMPQLSLLHDEPMSLHTTFRVGGPAALWAQPRSGDELAQALILARSHGVEPILLGAGSNILAPDAGLDTLVLQTRGMASAEVSGDLLTADCGVSLRRIAMLARDHGLTGLEFAHGIPGTLGGGLYMNAGAYGGELKDVVVSAAVLLPDGTQAEWDAQTLDFGYRHSALDALGAVALRATVRLVPGDPAKIAARMSELQTRRSASQRLDYPSAGSTFKRPVGGYAAALIDQAGLKGLTVGGAQVSEKHAGFVINRSGATAADILALMAQVQQRVWENSGIRLEPEVRILPQCREGIICNF